MLLYVLAGLATSKLAKDNLTGNKQFILFAFFSAVHIVFELSFFITHHTFKGSNKNLLIFKYNFFYNLR